MSGAKQAFMQQAGVANNLANAATPAIAPWNTGSAPCRCRAGAADPRVYVSMLRSPNF
jgi:hypothetical protein